MATIFLGESPRADAVVMQVWTMHKGRLEPHQRNPRRLPFALAPRASHARPIWDAFYTSQTLSAESVRPSSLAREAGTLTDPHASILELGCGIGADSAYFASEGHRVVGTDASRVALRRAQSTWQGENLTFRRHTLPATLPFADQSFDLVYARLSLHYFYHDATSSIFRECARLIRPGGQFVFSCRSTRDPLYGEGIRIGNAIYEHNGHVRHFFSVDYAEGLLQSHARLDVQAIQERALTLYEAPSVVIEAFARKTHAPPRPFSLERSTQAFELQRPSDPVDRTQNRRRRDNVLANP